MRRVLCHPQRGPEPNALLQVWTVQYYGNVSAAADHVVLHDGTLLRWHVDTLERAGALVVAVPGIPSPLPYTANDQMMLMKSWIINLNYEAVVYLDGDAFAVGSLAHLFAPDFAYREEFVGVSGDCEPINTGQFLLRPRADTFAQMYWTVAAGNFATRSGWNDTGPLEKQEFESCHRRTLLRKGRAWQFSQAHVDQGLFFYVYRFVRGSMRTLGFMRAAPAQAVLPVLHFAGPKPWSAIPQPTWRVHEWRRLLRTAWSSKLLDYGNSGCPTPRLTEA